MKNRLWGIIIIILSLHQIQLMPFYRIIKKQVQGEWSDYQVDFYPDLHPVRNLYLCCSELSSYSSLTNFDWHGSNIIKKMPINVPFGSMV
jgi:hypothetical protein